MIYLVSAPDSLWLSFVLWVFSPEIAFGIAVLAVIGSLYLVLRK